MSTDPTPRKYCGPVTPWAQEPWILPGGGEYLVTVASWRELFGSREWYYAGSWHREPPA